MIFSGCQNPRFQDFKAKSDRLLYKATALDESAHPSAEQPINEGAAFLPTLVP